MILNGTDTTPFPFFPYSLHYNLAYSQLKLAIQLPYAIMKGAYSMSKSKREGALRLSIFIIMIPLIFVVQSNPFYIAIVSFVALYALVTGVYRLTRK
jgi:hypothetical protein